MTVDRFQRAEQARQRHKANEEAVLANPDLSEEGRQHQVSMSWVAAADELRSQRDGYRADIEQEHRRLEQEFVLPPGLDSVADRTARMMAYRDCLDRAERVEGRELLALLQRSERIGDLLQVYAVVATAYERGLRPVLAAHFEAHPEKAEKFRRLQELGGQQGHSARIAAEMAFSVPPLPAGLPSESAVRDMAGGTVVGV